MTFGATLHAMAYGRARRWIIGGATLAIVAMASAFIIISQTYRLEFGSSYGHGTTANVHTAGPVTEFRYRFERNGLISLVTSLRNTGRLPVLLNDIALQEGPKERQFLQIEDLAIIYELPYPKVESREVAKPFAPFVLEPGSEVILYLTVRLPDTTVEGRIYVRDLWVSYSVMGMSRVEPVPMQFYLGVDGTISAS